MAVSLCVSLSSQAESNIVFADSVAEFSGTQGMHNWYYGYYQEPNLDAAHFMQMENFGPNAGYAFGDEVWTVSNDYWTALGKCGAHPNGTNGNGTQPVLQWAVRRWVSEASGKVAISGTYASMYDSDVSLRIAVDGKEVWRNDINSSTQGKYKLNVPVKVGSKVDFIVDPGQDNNDVNDHTRFTAKIALLDKPGISGLIEGMAVSGVTCANDSTGQVVTVKNASFWNCTTAGLVAKPGDKITQTAVGMAQ